MIEAAGRWAAARILDQIRYDARAAGHRLRRVVQPGVGGGERRCRRDDRAASAARASSTRRTARCGSAPSELGDDRDRVLVKSNGDATYLAGDLAYHRDKFLVRGFDRVIDIFGADHAGQVKSLTARGRGHGRRAGPARGQARPDGLARRWRAGRMSKRAGNFVALDDLDRRHRPRRHAAAVAHVARSTRRRSLDLDLVRSQSMENPVFYVQYAHARIASIERVRAERGIERLPLGEVDLSLLAHDRELEVLRRLEELPDVVADAGRDRAPHKVTTWVREPGRPTSTASTTTAPCWPTRRPDAHPGPAVARRGGAHRLRHRPRPLGVHAPDSM